MQAQERVRLYMLVSGLFDEPETVSGDYHFSLVAKLLRDAPADWPYRSLLEALERDLLAETGPERLAAEYDRLFVSGPCGAMVPPRGDFWLRGAAARDARELMANHGIALFGNAPEHADHLVTEVEFMACLVADDGDTRDLQRYFLRRHLARWLPRFAEAVFAEARLPRYRLAACLLTKLIEVESEFLGRSAPHRETYTESQVLQAA